MSAADAFSVELDFVHRQRLATAITPTSAPLSEPTGRSAWRFSGQGLVRATAGVASSFTMAHYSMQLTGRHLHECAVYLWSKQRQYVSAPP
jgi:hypothetical protein